MPDRLPPSRSSSGSGARRAPVPRPNRPWRSLASAERAGAEVKLFGAATLAALPRLHDRGEHDFVRGQGTGGSDPPRRRRDHRQPRLSRLDLGPRQECHRLSRRNFEGCARLSRRRSVGLIATAYGWQATGSTLATLRSIVHALRGWPTPLGAAINSSGGIFKGGCAATPAPATSSNWSAAVFEFARLRRVDPSVTERAPREGFHRRAGAGRPAGHPGSRSRHANSHQDGLGHRISGSAQG